MSQTCLFETFPGLWTSDPAIKKIVDQIMMLAKAPVSILLQGESGTGKELCARALHEHSLVSSGPFIAINCAAIPEGLLESELFGHEKGAFTGAIRQVAGKLENAHQGTLFLDEIGDLPLALQPKLLRFLEERIIERVGGREAIAVNVRIIAATHQPLEEWNTSHRFRADLYYRLGEVVLKLPPLRERIGDRLVLAWEFAKRYSSQFGVSLKHFSHEALAALEQHSWPGNIRELQNRIKRAVLLAQGPFIEPRDLDLVFEQVPFSQLCLRSVRETAERNAILRALAYMDQNVSKAADLLGVTRPTLYHLMEKYQLLKMAEVQS